MKKSNKDIIPFINISREVGTNKIYLAFVNLPAKVERFQWLPVHCYKNGNQFYHVYYRNTWMCRACKHIMNKPIVMPMVEVDSTIYNQCERKYPDIPSISPLQLLIFQFVKLEVVLLNDNQMIL